ASARPQSAVARRWCGGAPLSAPHEPYQAPEPYASRYAPYEAEVAYADAVIGTLVERLRADGALSRTLIVVAADHGESLGEHGERTHGVFVYDVTMQVPWIIARGRPAVQGSSGALVRLIDLAPTVLDLAGIASPSGFEGRSIVAAVNSREAEPAGAYIEAMDANITRNWAPLTGVVT